MNLATPILICHENEDFRTLLRTMLTKHGFFHVLDSSNLMELQELMKKEARSSFLLIEAELLNETMISKLTNSKEFLIILRQNEESALTLTARLGIKHFLSFPFSSQHLFEKINAIA